MAGEIRALTVRQPNTGALVWFGKNPENRTRPISHRGLVAIHAGLYEPDPGDYLAVRDTFNRARPAGITLEWDDQRRTRGAVLGVAELAGCHHASECWDPASRNWACSPWAFTGEWWHWQFTDPRPLACPVPCKGALGLWRLPADVEKLVRDQLEG